MTAPPDPLSALITFLKADVDLAALVSTRVFGDELPAGQTTAMPRKCVVVEPSGGTQSIGRAYQNYGDGRFDIKSYGETPFEAARVQLAVYGAMKALRRKTHSGVLLHWAIRSGGPLPLRDPDTDWPSRFESYQVLAAEVSV